jgi:hypothetical protein
MFYVGQLALITGNENGHCFQVGDIVTLTKKHGSGRAWLGNDALCGWILETDMAPCHEDVDYKELL